jgi:glycine cleavage system H protein
VSDLTTLKYTAEHEWLLIDGDTATVGITDYAADKLGDVVYVDLPAVGTDVEAGKVVGEIESTKSVGELFAPVLGTVLEINDRVVDSPDLVNSSPFDDGWLVKITLSGDLPALLSRDEYVALTAE